MRGAGRPARHPVPSRRPQRTSRSGPSIDSPGGPDRVGDRADAPPARDRRRVRRVAAVRRPHDRHGHPSGAEDRLADPDAAARRRRARLDREPEHDAAGGVRLPRRARGPHRRRADQRPGRARRLPVGGRALEAGSLPRQRRRPLRPLPRGAVRGPARRHRGDDLGPDAPRAAPRAPGAAGARHQRQPDQAVRGERARRRPGDARVVPAHHEPVDEREACDRLRLRPVREGRGRQLPERKRRPSRWSRSIP